MPAPLTITPLDADTRAELERRYNSATTANARLRYHIILLATQGYTAPRIARLILRSDDMVLDILHRFQAGGLDAVPRHYAPGRPRTVTSAWEDELVRVIERDPHDVDVDSANWTTGLLAAYLTQVTGIGVTQETVRAYLHAHDYVCKRPTWTLKRKAEEQEGYVGNACG
jgi:transposase